MRLDDLTGSVKVGWPTKTYLPSSSEAARAVVPHADSSASRLENDQVHVEY